MTIALLATGSRGDVQPYVALGAALERAGQRVRIAAAEPFRELVARQGLAFHPLPGDVAAIARDPSLRGTLQAQGPLAAIRGFRLLSDMAYGMQADLFEACEGADAVCFHPGAAIGAFAAQRMGVPSVLASPFPMTPTTSYPALIFYGTVRLGSWSNRLTHQVFEQVMWRTSARPLKRFWAERFGEEPTPFDNPYPRHRTQRNPTIVSCSRYVFPEPEDWPEHVHQKGFWFLEEGEGWTPPEDLRAFLEEGPPPVYVGFGSMAGDEAAEELTWLVVGALHDAGMRAVIATGWGALKTVAGGRNVYMLRTAPHDWLFPKMAAVVHHGGAGTTAAGLRAGVPSIVIPHANDQFAWGRRVHELGVGPRPIRRKRLTRPALAAAVEEAMTEDVQKAAAVLGMRIRSEPGADAAAQVVLEALATS